MYIAIKYILLRIETRVGKDANGKQEVVFHLATELRSSLLLRSRRKYP